jgi:hypothetical protein
MSQYARNTDPVESHLAAASLDHFVLSKVEEAIYKLLALPMTDEELVNAYRHNASLGVFQNHSDSGIRTRRNQLHLRGLIRVKGVTTNRNGKQVRIWERLEK